MYFMITVNSNLMSIFQNNNVIRKILTFSDTKEMIIFSRKINKEILEICNNSDLIKNLINDSLHWFHLFLDLHFHLKTLLTLESDQDVIKKLELIVVSARFCAPEVFNRILQDYSSVLNSEISHSHPTFNKTVSLWSIGLKSIENRLKKIY